MFFVNPTFLLGGFGGSVVPPHDQILGQIFESLAAADSDDDFEVARKVIQITWPGRVRRLRSQHSSVKKLMQCEAVFVSLRAELNSLQDHKSPIVRLVVRVSTFF